MGCNQRYQKKSNYVEKFPHTEDTDCADNSIVSKTKQNILVPFGNFFVIQALRGDNPQVKHLPRVDNLRVQSGTTPCF